MKTSKEKRPKKQRLDIRQRVIYIIYPASLTGCRKKLIIKSTMKMNSIIDTMINSPTYRKLRFLWARYGQKKQRQIDVKIFINLKGPQRYEKGEIVYAIFFLFLQEASASWPPNIGLKISSSKDSGHSSNRSPQLFLMNDWSMIKLYMVSKQ